jgi:hypothetical protein
MKIDGKETKDWLLNVPLGIPHKIYIFFVVLLLIFLVFRKKKERFDCIKENWVG